MLAAAAGARAAPLAFTGPSLIDPTGMGQYSLAVTCASSTQCTAVDASGQEVTYDPSAPGHPAAHVIDPGRSLAAISCSSDVRCTAVDASGDEVTFDPQSPGSPPRVAVSEDGDATGPVLHRR